MAATRADDCEPAGRAVADALAIVGEKWTLLIVRELSRGTLRLNDIQRKTGAPRGRLAIRLRKPEECGVAARHRCGLTSTRGAYRLTGSGEALAPALDALQAWGRQYCERTAGGE